MVFTAYTYCILLQRLSFPGTPNMPYTPEPELRALLAIGTAYAGFEFLLKRFLRRAVGRKRGAGERTAAWSALLFVSLAVMTSAYFSLALCAGYVAAGGIYAGFQLTEERTDLVRRKRSLEFFLTKQVTMGIVLFLVWRTVQPAAAADVYVSLERWFFGPAHSLHASLHAQMPRVLLVLSCYLFAVDGGTRIVRGTLEKFPKLYGRAIQALGRSDENGVKEEENAGEWIGVFERLLALTFVLTGNFTALAFAVAAKSVARFKELENKDFAEYFLIGTSASLVSAVLAGLVLHAIVTP